jgi:hypothetical protein
LFQPLSSFSKEEAGLFFLLQAFAALESFIPKGVSLEKNGILVRLEQPDDVLAQNALV